MMRVLVSDALSEQGLNILRQTPGAAIDYKPGLNEADLAAAVVGADALVIRSGSKVTARVIAAADKLKVIGRAGIGVDNVDVEAASKKGIVVMNTPTGNAVTTAEHALSLLMSLARHVPQASALLKAGKWEKKKFEGRELSGKTLAVVGLGNIGRIVADRARGLSMKVIGFDPMITAERAAQLGVELCTLDEIFARADAITVHTPLTAQTKGLINEGVLPKLKKGVLLINAARGGIYDEAALLKGLESGQIGGVALDVFIEEPPPADMPLLKHDRVIATPHLGASTKEAQDRVALEIADQIVMYLTTGEIKNAVNTPSVAGEIAIQQKPYLDLAERLGSFLAQVEPALSPKAIEVECTGKAADLGVKGIAAAAVAGCLSRYLAASMNRVSAPVAAKERGISVRELASSGGSEYASRIVLRVTGADGQTHAVWGAVGADGSPRLLKWDDYEVEAHLGGPTLVIKNLDKPGVIGAIGTALGSADVNVARVHLGVAKPGGALSVWNLDSPPQTSVIETLRRSPHVQSVTIIHV
ncbi:MAG: phosphoglycerate dehydrogenase [Polyangiaceae bacterium]|nr:phosphoglycerate dehydrogenase [Polyangiaceae bacterium]